MTFDIPYPPTKDGRKEFNKKYSLNAFYSGKNCHARSRDAKDLHLMALAAMKKARIPRKYVPWPVEVRFYWDDGLDCDNHAVLGKAFLDAMKGYILPDDNRRYVKRVVHEFWDGGCIRVEVRKYELHGFSSEQDGDRSGIGI